MGFKLKIEKIQISIVNLKYLGKELDPFILGKNFDDQSVQCEKLKHQNFVNHVNIS